MNVLLQIPQGGREDPVAVSVVGDAADVTIAMTQISAMLLPPEPEEIPFEWSKEVNDFNPPLPFSSLSEE